ncbi:hypothetical protein BS50DRAFT_578675 [Corynespora cassiicola Philippines]|uniref:Uncharacterized protein n=1 Tax=Corynespora cassiicola Philippines TaxID=1448308 RepID=A0A2T2N794_CORCC|nr:hypothetical protein BS50DRAFT_578675 [Corynespora cassiicola Philippines]
MHFSIPPALWSSITPFQNPGVRAQSPPRRRKRKITAQVLIQSIPGTSHRKIHLGPHLSAVHNVWDSIVCT